jgi:cyanamide hydratase
MSTLYSRDTTATYGFITLPADQTATPPSTSSPSTVPVSELKVPTSPLAKRIHAYTKEKLDSRTFNHSLRVYSYGLAISRQCFPDWKVDEGSKLEETWFCCAMLHDIGTTTENITATRLSYEFWAGVHALEILQDASLTGGSKDENAEADKEQAESVAEAIIRHQDVQEKGSITLLTRLIHLGTLLDNIGAGRELVSKGTINGVNGEYDRQGWSGCFRSVVEKEKKEKPYAMVSRIEGFEGFIAKNDATTLGGGKDGL